jgi:hypothetical protein
VEHECEGLHEARHPEEDQQRVASQLLLRRDLTRSMRNSRSVSLSSASLSLQRIAPRSAEKR